MSNARYQEKQINRIFKSIISYFLIMSIIVSVFIPAQAEEVSENDIIDFDNTEVLDSESGASSQISIVRTSVEMSAVILEDGSLYMWGAGSPGKYSKPTIVMSNVKDIQFGDGSPIVLKNDGTVWCWKYENSETHEFELGSYTGHITKEIYKVLDDVKEIRAGYGSFAAIKNNGDLWTWGTRYNLLGQGIQSTSGTKYYEPKCILHNIVKVMMSNDDDDYGKAGAIDSNGNLYFWGEKWIDDDESEYGDTEYIKSPEIIAYNVVDYKFNYHIDVILKDNGKVYTRGNNAYGQLGDGSKYSRDSYFEDVLSDVVAIEVIDFDAVAAIKKDGTLWMWGVLSPGYSTWWEDTEDTIYAYSPNLTKPYKVASNVKKVVGSYQGFSILRTDNSLWSWGYVYTDLYALGDYDEIYSNPVRILTDVSDVVYSSPDCYDVRFSSYAAIKTDGSLWMWGNNSFGQIANGYSGKFKRIQIPKAEYKVSFVNLDEGLNIQNQIVKYDEHIKKPKTPTKEDFEFLGWYSNILGYGKAWDFENDTVKSNTVLYAVWRQQEISLSYSDY